MTTTTTTPVRDTPIGVGMLFALGRLNKPIYGGTVPAATIAHRRASNRTARCSRRINRRH